MNATIKYFLFILLVVFTSCENREWDNPFDPDCPKELFTPFDFKAIQEGTQIKLTWSQSNTKISGFVVERSVDGSTWASVATPSKTELTWSDSNITGGKVHEYRIVAKAGSNSSNQITAQVIPVFASTLTTIPLTKLLSTTAFLGGEIISDGGSPVTARGVCWNASPNPTISNSKTTDGTGTGSFTSTITGLSTVTTYYARAYATNSTGTAYGNEISFKTFFGEVTDIEGNVYPTVKIGEQIWMAENLKVTKYNDGTAIPNVTDNTQWANLTTAAYCWYNNDVNNKNTAYGALYNWYTVNTNKLAPAGWHVPTDAEWTTLTTYLGGENIAGGKLKEAGTSHWLSPNTNATNESGFTSLPGGARYVDGTFVNLGSNGGWWSSTFYDTQTLWIRDIYRAEGKVSRGYAYNKWGYSIRCIYGTLSLPVVSTVEISNKTTTSATSGGNITSDGGTPVTVRGVCWNSSPNPTIANSKTTDGTGTGSFTSNMTGLTENTTYYVRAYAINSQGTAYGNEVSFTTNQANLLATVITTFTNLTSTGAIVGGNVTDKGSSDITERGICWSWDPWSNLPTKEDSFKIVGSGTGVYNTELFYLESNTTHYIRAYAINSQGISYGNVVSFKTNSLTEQTVTDIEGNVYKTVTIGTQVWMAENLKTTKYNDGMAISYVPDTIEWTNLTSGAFCWYFNDINNKAKYGGLYNWSSVNTGKLCPSGWHVPNDTEWTILETYLGGNNVAGDKMKATIGWYNDGNGTNISGFSGLPGGARSNIGKFGNISKMGMWWSSSDYNATSALYLFLDYSIDDVYNVNGYKGNGNSIRCLKD